MIPSCQLSAEFNNFLSSPKTNIPSLKYHVKLQGAKKPYDSFLIKPPTATLTSMAEGTCIIYCTSIKVTTMICFHVQGL